MEDRIAALRERVILLEETIRALAPQLPGAGGTGGRPVIASFITGPVISAPAAPRLGLSPAPPSRASPASAFGRGARTLTGRFISDQVR